MSDERLTPYDRERLQLDAIERWNQLSPRDRGQKVYWAKQRARRSTVLAPQLTVMDFEPLTGPRDAPSAVAVTAAKTT